MWWHLYSIYNISCILICGNGSLLSPRPCKKTSRLADSDWKVSSQNRHTSRNTLNSRGKPSKPSKGSAKLCKANLRPAIGLQHNSIQQTSLIDSKVLSNRSEIRQPRSCTVFCSYAIMAPMAPGCNMSATCKAGWQLTWLTSRRLLGSSVPSHVVTVLCSTKGTMLDTADPMAAEYAQGITRDHKGSNLGTNDTKMR
jgi:hypothetical protein